LRTLNRFTAAQKHPFSPNLPKFVESICTRVAHPAKLSNCQNSEPQSSAPRHHPLLPGATNAGA
jgi:hypothetical protein